MLPILYQNHDLIIYSYPLLMGIGWGIAYQVYFSLMSPRVSRFKAQLLFWGVFLFAWIGAKILFYFTYPDDIETTIMGSVSFWTGGGFVFYGGFLGGALFLSLFKAFDKKLGLEILWPMLPALAIGHGIGRIGCFLAGCCYGKPTDFFWGVFMHDHYRHPTQLIEASVLLILGIYLIRSKSNRLNLLAQYLLVYGLLRFFIEILRGDIVRGSWGSLTPSQWISITLILAGLALLFRSKFRQLKAGKLF